MLRAHRKYSADEQSINVRAGFVAETAYPHRNAIRNVNTFGGMPRTNLAALPSNDGQLMGAMKAPRVVEAMNRRRCKPREDPMGVEQGHRTCYVESPLRG